ncbi:MAG: peptide chain release factor N(5)-glutamine methyltransferase [Bacteroidota bacterium]
MNTDAIDRAATRGPLLRAAAQALAAGSVEAPQRHAAWMLEELLGCTQAQLVAYPDVPVPAEVARQVAAWVTRRLQGEPLQYLLGHADFLGLRLQVSPAVLIPRPETEEVAVHALAALETILTPTVLDIGTGSGALALALQHRRPDAHVVACDVSTDALAIAQANAAAHHLPVRFVEADALAPGFPGRVGGGPFDLVVSNPPYIPDAERDTLQVEVRDHEPALALFSGDDPLRFYRAIAAHAQVLLRPGGWLVFEGHADYAEAVADHLGAEGYQGVVLHEDLAGHPRIVSGCWPVPEGR